MATRLYLTNDSPGYNPPTKRGAWDNGASAITQALGFSPAGAAATVGVAEAVTTNNYDVLLGRWVSRRIMTAGNVTGTVQGVFGAVESAAGLNAFWHVHIYATVGSTDVVRGTILTDTVAGTEFPTTAAGVAFPSTAVTSTAVQPGDRIVVEIGYQAQNTTATSMTATMNYGNTGTTALTAGSAAVTTQPGWIEFSGTDDLFSTSLNNLVDNFDDNAVNSTIWTDTYGGVSETGGRARVPTTTGYSAYATGPSYLLDEAGIFVRAYPAAVSGATAECWSQLLVQTLTPGTDAIMEYNAVANTLVMSSRVGYFDAGSVSITYSATDHAWWRIRETGGTLYWDTSPDGATWTNRRNVTSPSWVTDKFLSVQLISHRGDGVDNYSEWDNVNVSPSTAWTQTPADNVGVTDSLAIDRVGNPADNENLTDTTVVSVGRNMSQADNVGVTDSTVIGFARVASADDSVGVTDSISVFLGRTQDAADTVGVTDTTSFVHDWRPSHSDSENLTDTISSVYQGQRTFDDAENVTDTSVVSQGHNRLPADNENVTDSTVVSQGHGRLPADTEGLSDSIAIQYDGIRTPSDSENVTDSLAKQYGNVKADNVGITDSVVTDKTSLPVVPPSTRPMVGLVIKLFDPAPSALSDMGPFGAGGDVVSVCPDIKAVSWTDELSQSGTVSIEYPMDGVNYALLTADRAEGAVFWGEMEIPGTRFLVAEQARDPLDEQGSVVKINAPAFVGKRLEEAIVHPARWPTPTPPQQTFTTVTPGALMLTLITQAQDRGALGNLEVDFTGLVDSNGAAWSQTVSMTINIGETYRAVLNKLVEMGVVDWRGEGRTLQMFNWGTLGTDKSVGSTPVILFAGRDMLDSPENRSVLNLANAVYSLGEDAWSSQVSDSTSIAQFGRIEAFISSSGVSNTGTLSVIGQAYLDKLKHAQREFTHALTFADETAPVPYTDYRVGDKILRSVNGVTEAFVVRQLTFSMDDNGDLKSTITLNDKFYTNDVLLERKMKALTGGSGSSTSSPADTTSDTVPPKAPTGLSLTSDAYVGNAGVTYAAVQALWTEPTENTDDSTMTDLDHYEVQWKYDTVSVWSAAGTSGGNVLQWSWVMPGRNINARVRAVDRNGNKSDWSTTANHLTASDTTAPAEPSTPVVSNYLGVLRVTWDGLTNGGGSQPSDFAGAEVHISTVNGFTPSSATKVDTLPAAGVAVISALHDGTPLVYGTTYYVKLVSFDRSGNTSTPSGQGSGSPSQVVQTDIGTGQVGLSNLSFSDVGNLIDDGSFELANWRTSRASQIPAFSSFATDQASNGLYSLKLVGTTSSATWVIRSGITVRPGEVYVGAWDFRVTAGFTGTTILVGRFRDAAGAQVGSALSLCRVPVGSAGSTWFQRQSDLELTVPAGASTMDLELSVTNLIGTIWLDAVEVRQRVDSLLVANAAITNAKIANLAVNDAKISDLSVAKVTAGTISADWIVGARIKTADTGARVELNSTGLRAYNSGGTNTVSFLSSDGSAYMLGQVVSGTTGKRLELNPTSTRLPEMRLYPNTGSNYSFINAITDGTGTQSWIGVNSGQFAHPVTGETSTNRLFMLDGDSGMYLEMIRASDQVRNGPRLRMWDDGIYMNLQNTTDADYLGFLELYRDQAGIGLNQSGTATDAWLRFNVDGKFDFVGSWFDYVGVAANAGLFTGSVDGTSNASTFATTFGPTMASQLLPLTAIRDNVVHSYAITDSTSTGFELTISPAASGTWAIYMWCYRI